MGVSPDSLGQPPLDRQHGACYPPRFGHWALLIASLPLQRDHLGISLPLDFMHVRVSLSPSVAARVAGGRRAHYFILQNGERGLRRSRLKREQETLPTEYAKGYLFISLGHAEY